MGRLLVKTTKRFDMKKVFTCRNILSVTAFVFLLSPMAHAQLAVFDGANFGQLVEQVAELEKQYTELQSQGQHIKTSLNALTSLPNFQWSNADAMSMMGQINTVMQRNQAIAYNASNLDSQFTAHFPGYVGSTNGQSYQARYQTNTNDTLNTINNSLASIGMNTGDFANESTRLDTIHNHVQGAVGQTQTLQALSEVNEELVTQTQSLRQIVSAQANSEAVYFANQVQKEASSKANLDDVIAAGNTSEVVYGSNPDNILHSP